MVCRTRGQGDFPGLLIFAGLDGRCKRIMGIYLVTLKYTLLNQEMRNTFYYETTVGEPSNSEWQDIADEIRTDWVTELQAQMVNDISLYGIDRRRVDIAGLNTFPESFTSGAAFGTEATDPLPTQIAMLVSVKGSTTKPNRARTYLPGWHDTQCVAGLFNSTPRGAAEDFIDLMSALNSAGTNPLQRVSAQWNTSHTAVVASNNIAGSAAVASVVPATQRRRRIGVGI